MPMPYSIGVLQSDHEPISCKIGAPVGRAGGELRCDPVEPPEADGPHQIVPKTQQTKGNGKHERSDGP